MTWKDVLALGPTAISRAIGCPVTTASSWIHRGGPAEWEQNLIIKAIGETSPNTDKDNQPNVERMEGCKPFHALDVAAP